MRERGGVLSPLLSEVRGISLSIEVMSAVLHNSKATGTNKLVLLGIANHEGDGGSWPSIATLCKYANCSDTRVRTAIKWLVKNGELEVDQQKGGNANTRPDRRPNLYRVLVPLHGVKTGSPRDDERGQLSEERGQLFEVTGSTRVHPNRPIEPSILELSSKTIFEAFWDNYPRQTAIGKAKTAFVKALKTGVSPATLIEAAAKFADDPNREDEFTPHAATWLNQERWNDAPLPMKAKNKSKGNRELEIKRTKDIIAPTRTTLSPANELEIEELRKRITEIANQKHIDTEPSTNGSKPSDSPSYF